MSSNQNKCYICQMEFSIPEDLCKHIPICRQLADSGSSSVLETKTFFCNDCTEGFSHFEDLIKHQSEHAADRGEYPLGHQVILPDSQLENPVTDCLLTGGESSHDGQLINPGTGCPLTGGESSHDGQLINPGTGCPLTGGESSHDGQLVNPGTGCSLTGGESSHDGQLVNPGTGSLTGRESAHDGLLVNLGTGSLTGGESSHDGQLVNPGTGSLTGRESSHDGQLVNPGTGCSLTDGERSHDGLLVNPGTGSLTGGESSHNGQLVSSTVIFSLVGGNISQYGHLESFTGACLLEPRESSTDGQLKHPIYKSSIDCENSLQDDQLEHPPKDESSLKGGQHSQVEPLDNLGGESSHKLGKISDDDQVEIPTEKYLCDSEYKWPHNDGETSHDAQLENYTEKSSIDCGETSHAGQLKNPTDIYTSLVDVARSQEAQLQIPEGSCSIEGGNGSHDGNITKTRAKFVCQMCGKLSLNRSYLEQHIRTHTGEKPFKCDICNKPYSHKGNMKAHRMSHFRKERRRPSRKNNVSYKKGHSLRYKKAAQGDTAESKHESLPKQFACSYCDKRYVHYSNVEKHEKKHCILNRYSCPECGVYYLDVQWLQTRRFKIAHVKSCGNLPKSFNHVCLNIPQVRQTFTTTSSFHPSKFQLHTLELQVRNPFVFIECSACCSKVSLREGLQSQNDQQQLETKSIPDTDDRIDSKDSNVNTDTHSNDNKRLRRNRKAFKCSDCGKWFADENDLKVHLTHAGGMCLVSSQVNTTTLPPSDATKIQGGVCSICQKVIPKRSDLIKHYRAHSRVTSYECPKCGLKMTDPSSWRKHERSKACREAYKNRKKELHKCAVCGQCFIEKLQLKKHFNRHRGQRKFDCGECGAEFSNPNDLKCHAKVHRKQAAKDRKNTKSVISGYSKMKRKIAATKTSKSGMLKDPTKHRLKKKKSHTKPSRSYKCSYCGKLFPIMSHLIRHFRMHTGAKPFKCEYCSETFSYPASLKKHALTHLGVRESNHSPFVTSGHGVPATPGRDDHSYNVHNQQVSYDPQQIALHRRDIDSKRAIFKHEALSTYMLQVLDQDTAKQRQQGEMHSHSNVSHSPYMALQQNDLKSNHPGFAGPQPINYLPQNQFIEPNKPPLQDNLRAQNTDISYHAVPISIHDGMHSYSGMGRSSGTGDLTHWSYPQSTLVGQPNPIHHAYVNRPLQEAESLPTSVKHTDINQYAATHPAMDPDRLLQELEHFSTQSSQFSSNDPNRIHNQVDRQPYMESNPDHPLQSKGVLGPYPHYINNGHGSYIQQETLHAQTPPETEYRMQLGVHSHSPQETAYHMQLGEQNRQDPKYGIPLGVHSPSPLYAKSVLQNVSQSKDFNIQQDIDVSQDQSVHQENINENTVRKSAPEPHRNVEQNVSVIRNSQATEGSVENPLIQEDLSSQSSDDPSSTRDPPPIEDVLLLLNLFKK